MGRVDEQRPEREEDGHGGELHALGEGSGDERGGDDGEHELVDHVGLFGNRRGVIGIGREADAAEKDVFEAADEGVAVAEGERVAADGPEDGDEAHHGEALHHGAEDVFAADEAAVEEREAGAGHEQNERGGDQHPGVVGVHLRGLDLLLELGELSLRNGCSGRLGKAECGREKYGRDGQGTGRATARHSIPLRREMRFAGGPQARAAGHGRRDGGVPVAMANFAG